MCGIAETLSLGSPLAEADHALTRRMTEIQRHRGPDGRRALAARLPVSREKLSFDFLAKRFTEGAELGVPEAHVYWRHVLSEDEKRRLFAGAEPERPTASLFRDLFVGKGDYREHLERGAPRC